MNITRNRASPFGVLLAIVVLILSQGIVRPAQAEGGDTAAAAQANRKIVGSILNDASHAGWIAEGKSVHIIYVFFDPNCPYCDKLYHELRPWVEHNEVQVRWLPLGYLMTTSLGKAAAMLEAKDPGAALRINETGFSRATGFGQISEDPLPGKKVVSIIKANEKLLLRSGRRLVPTMVFRAADGTPVMMRGAPSESDLQQIIEQVK